MSDLKLTVVSPTGGVGPVECSSIHLFVSDGENGSKGGSYGIRRGHSMAVFSLAKGKTDAFVDGNLVFSVEHEAGFAVVNNNTVKITVESYSELKV